MKITSSIMFSIIFVLGLVLLALVYIYFKPNKNKIETKDESGYFIKVIHDLQSYSTAYVFYGLFVILLGLLWFKKSEEVHILSSDLLTNNLGILTILLCVSLPLIILTPTLYKTNKKLFDHDSILMSSGFWIETFIFSFLATVGENMAILGDGEPITMMSMLTPFMTFATINVMFEVLGFNRWIYPMDEVDKKCKVNTDASSNILKVDTTNCMDYKGEDNINNQVTNETYFMYFLAIVVVAVLIIPAIKFYFNKDVLEVLTFDTIINKLIYSVIIGILIGIATEYTSYRRGHKHIAGFELGLISAKFMIHHYLWNIVRLDKLTI